MKARYLEVTYRKGKPWAAYLYLPRPAGTKSARSRRLDKGMVADFSASGEIIGVEITAPTLVTVADINAVLTEYHQPELSSEELTPIAA